MTYWHQGRENEAREMYNRAVAWTEKNKPDDPELRKFRAEADALLSTSCPKRGAAARTVAAPAEPASSTAVSSDVDEPGDVTDWGARTKSQDAHSRG